MRALLWAVTAAVIVLRTAAAADVPAEFDDPRDLARYESLLEELRCLVCQNQSLADSHADLAQDMRDEVYRMVNNGEPDAAITDFLGSRYGDFVLYRPPVKPSTWVRWGGPFILLATAAGVIVSLGRRRAREPEPLDETERARLQALMNNDETPPS